MRPLYEVRNGFSPPMTNNDTMLPESFPCYEVWRRKTLFRPAEHLDTFFKRRSAQAVCDSLNGHKR